MSQARRAIAARVRWAWLSGPLALASVLLYLFAGAPWAFVSLVKAGVPDSFAVAAAVLPLAAFFLTQRYSPEMSVGDDGVLFRWFGWTRFIPYRDLRACVASEERSPAEDTGSPDEAPTFLRLVLRDGKSVKLRAGGSGARGGRFVLGAEIVQRIRAGIEAAAHDTTDSRDEVRKLSRGDREAAVWLGDLTRRLQDRGYRGGAVNRDELLGIVESSLAAPTARVGAAAILRKSGLQGGERARLRIAAASSVAPKVRIALETAADESAEERAFEEAAAKLARAEMR